MTTVMRLAWKQLIYWMKGARIWRRSILIRIALTNLVGLVTTSEITLALFIIFPSYFLSKAIWHNCLHSGVQRSCEGEFVAGARCTSNSWSWMAWFGRDRKLLARCTSTISRYLPFHFFWLVWCGSSAKLPAVTMRIAQTTLGLLPLVLMVWFGTVGKLLAVHVRNCPVTSPLLLIGLFW